MQCRACGAEVPDDSGYVCPTCGRHPGSPDANEGDFVMAEGSGGQGPAFENRDSLGFMPALIETTKGVLLDPTATFRTAKRKGLENPILFAVVLGAFGGLFEGIWNLVFQTSIMAIAGATGGSNAMGPGAVGVGVGILTIPFAAIGGVIGSLISMFVYGGMAHLILMAFKSDQNGFEATARVAGYAQAWNAFKLIPIFGALIGAVWFFVVLTIGLKEAQNTDTGQAAVAAVGPVVICCLCILVPIFFLGFSAAFAGAASGGGM